MPAMPRPKGKAKKIAWSILGKPANLQDTKTKKERKIQQQLLRQETAYVR